MGHDCTVPSSGNRLDVMRRRAVDAGIPLHCTFALTHRCNLRCIHCYVRPEIRDAEHELAASAWLDLAREAASAGCFSVLLTGGEPLIRDDFPEIYLGIRRLGVHVMVFTNATKVSDAVINVMREAPPRLVEVSIYGASADTYRSVTGSGSAYHDALQGVQRLRDAGVKVRLKTVLMRTNVHEFSQIQAMAKSDEAAVRYDAVLQSRFPGDPVIAGLRVPPAEVAALEASAVPEARRQWQIRHDRRASREEMTQNHLYSCAAGLISLYMTADGYMQPCVSTARYAVRYQPGRFLAQFKLMRETVRSVAIPDEYRCRGCDARVYCGSCPPVAELEGEAESGVCGYACDLAWERYALRE